MEITSLYEENIGLEEVELLVIGYLKNQLTLNEENINELELEKFIEKLKETIGFISNILKNQITINYSYQDLLKNVPVYIEKTKSDKYPIITVAELKDFKLQLSKMKSFRKKLDFLKHFLELDNRMSYNRGDFINKIVNDFSEVKINSNKETFTNQSNGNLILDLPFSDINLEGFGFSIGDINPAIDKFQVMIDAVIQKQINSNNQYKTINLLFLGNIINRNLVLEQDFQETLINYNLTFEFSMFLLKTTFLLRKFFKNVNLVFSIEKGNYRPDENKEHFRNYNLNFDRIIPKLLKNKTIGMQGIQISDSFESDFFNAMKYQNGLATILYGDLKGSNQLKVKFSNYEKKFLKELENKNQNIKRVTRFYIGGKDLFFYNDFYRKIRQIPSFFEVNMVSQGNGLQLVYFTLDSNGNELEKNWIDSSGTEPKIFLHNVNYKKDIQFYDFIQNTILTNKKDKENIILAL